MRRSLKTSAPKLSPDSQRLINLAQAMAQASSRLEERTWEQKLDLLVQKQLKQNHQDTINAALDHLFRTEPPAYDALMDTVEAVSESCFPEQDGQRYDALLIAVPVLAWTRFSIPSGPLSAETMHALSAHLHGHLVAQGARVALAPLLYAIDQLPQTHADTYALTQRMAQAALAGKPIALPANLPETAPFLADTRYLLAVVLAPTGAPLFRWHEAPLPASIRTAQEEALVQWRSQTAPVIERLLPGCGIELLLPEAYYVACREADRRIRPVSLRAAVNYLTQILTVEPDGLSAIVGGFAEDSTNSRVDEYRISFMLKGEPEVIYGVVWPLYGQEDTEEAPMPLSADSHMSPLYVPPGTDHRAPLQQILALLRESGIPDVKVHQELFQAEYCEDCGSPLYCDRDAELVHAEMPEDAPQGSGHLH